MQGVTIRHHVGARLWVSLMLLMLPIVLLVYESIARQYQHFSLLEVLMDKVSSHWVERSPGNTADNNQQQSKEDISVNEFDSHKVKSLPEHPCPDLEKAFDSDCSAISQKSHLQRVDQLNDEELSVEVETLLDIKATQPFTQNASTLQNFTNEEQGTANSPFAKEYPQKTTHLGDNPEGKMELPTLAFTNSFDEHIITSLIDNHQAYLLCQNSAFNWFAYQPGSGETLRNGEFAPFYGSSEINQRLSQRMVPGLPEQVLVVMEKVFYEQYKRQCQPHLRLSRVLDSKLAYQQVTLQKSNKRKIAKTLFELKTEESGEIHFELQELVYEK